MATWLTPREPLQIVSLTPQKHSGAIGFQNTDRLKQFALGRLEIRLKADFNDEFPGQSGNRPSQVVDDVEFGRPLKLPGLGDNTQYAIQSKAPETHSKMAKPHSVPTAAAKGKTIRVEVALAFVSRRNAISQSNNLLLVRRGSQDVKAGIVTTCQGPALSEFD